MKSFKDILKENNWEGDDLSQSLIDHYYSIPKQHFDSLYEYTKESTPLNTYHWNKHLGESDPTEDSEFANDTKRLDTALHHFKAPYDFHVHSGLLHDPRTYAHYGKNKDTIHHPAYLSTSINKDEAANYALGDNVKGKEGIHKHILKINIPKGHPGAYVEHISEHPEEKEFILPRGMNLKLVHHEEEKTPFHVYHIHHAEIVPHGS